jgi:hypothetical protein
MKAVSIAVLTAVLATGPLAAQTQSAEPWGVRAPPAAWRTPAPAPQPPPATQTPAAPMRAALQEALVCAAALQLSNLAAPAWSSQAGVAQATNNWLAAVFARAEAGGVSGDRVRDLVTGEMNRQADEAAADPAILSRRAFDCAARPPG